MNETESYLFDIGPDQKGSFNSLVYTSLTLRNSIFSKKIFSWELYSCQTPTERCFLLLDEAKLGVMTPIDSCVSC